MTLGSPADIRVGIIGFGYATRTFHLPLLQATPGFGISVIASTRAPEVRAALPGVEVVADHAALVRHPAVDLIVIATPNETHAPLAEAAVRAGRHVVVDKPFTVTAAQARHLAVIARQSGVVLSVFHNRRWDSDFLTVREVLHRGLLGQVVTCESRVDRFRPEVRDRWREGTAAGAGLLYDLGPHLIDQALVLFGIPDTVQATLARQRPGARSVDYFHLVLRYGGRLVVALQAGMLGSGGSARFTMHGDRASLVKHHPDMQEVQLRAGVVPGAPGWGVDADAAVVFDGRTGETSTVAAVPGDQRRYYAALGESLRGQAMNPVSPAQGAAVVAIIEAALQSEAEGCRRAPDLRDDERAAWSAVP